MKKILIIILFCISVNINSQDNSNQLSGNLNFDSKISFDETKINLDDNNTIEIAGKKSKLLAGLMSAVLPGAGEFYTENYLKSLIFVAIEAAAITAAIIYDKKGDDQTTVFENYANENWDVKRYARWTIENANNINPGIDDVNQYKVFDNNDNINWSELNKLENAIGNYYSHRLAPLGDQQYYEMIGKYQQFNVGWSEFGDDPTKPFKYEDPLVSQFLFYSKQRGEANDFYSVSSTSVKILVANHIISTLDAIWSASKFNKNLSMKLKVENINLGYKSEIYPKLNIRYNF